MKKDLNYYKDWYNKWIKVFRYLADKCEQTYRVRELLEKIKTHFQIIEWRLLCVKWFDVDKVESSSLFAKFR